MGYRRGLAEAEIPDWDGAPILRLVSLVEEVNERLAHAKAEDWGPWPEIVWPEPKEVSPWLRMRMEMATARRAIR